MSWFSDFFRSSVGKKAVMAVSGLVLFGFVLVHMLGNLKLFLPAHPDGTIPINVYGEFLRHIGEPLVPAHSVLWIARLVLLAAVVLHIWSAWAVTQASRAARPVQYQKREVVQATYASRTMRWGGVIILLFVLYHLAHLTFGWLGLGFIEGDVRHNLIAGFSVWWVATFYAVAQIALGFHLFHGLWSLFQSLGWNHPRYNAWRRGFATVFAWVITLGNLSFPVAVLAGWVR
ncbi:MAG TPA: succinate dehydrogenase cytochrome b subunit [Thermoanaerobaculia bacterium]|jgi:succinate dehydrogenase / fumarate reductase cytochrome b subunit|nr:succinate dehydrogenase cytochrome b subunit [Thermoanaerobaculia bacterium]